VPPNVTELFTAYRHLPQPGGQFDTVIRVGDLGSLSIKQSGSSESACRDLPGRAPWENAVSRGADINCERADAGTMTGQWTESGTAWSWSAQGMTKSELQALLDRITILR
jgi:hypothetical protein